MYDFKDYNSAIGQTNAIISVAMVVVIPIKDFELRNTYPKLGTNTSIQKQGNQLYVINYTEATIALKQDMVQLTHDVKQDLV